MIIIEVLHLVHQQGRKQPFSENGLRGRDVPADSFLGADGNYAGPDGGTLVLTATPLKIAWFSDKQVCMSRWAKQVCHASPGGETSSQRFPKFVSSLRGSVGDDAD